MTIKEILEFNLINIANYHINLIDIIEVTLIITAARLVIWLLEKLLGRFFRIKQIDVGRQYAIKRFLKYIIYTFMLLLAMQSVGINLTLLWTGSAALLVGIGLGLQEMFTNLISGIILLIEGTVEVGDMVVVDGMVGKVEEIGIRTSKVHTRDDIVVIVPNSKLVTNNVVNWNHNESPTRFQIKVGVAYSADVDLVTKLLLEAAKNHPNVLDTPAPTVQLIDFGDSSLDFLLYFFTNEFWRIEAVRSDLRFSIVRSFRQNGVEIPFPQRDLWVRNPRDLVANGYGGKQEVNN